MRYFENPNDNNKVYGYDSATQSNLIDSAVANGWVEVTGSWPPAQVITLSQKITNAIAKTYADVDAVYALAVGNREPEYRDAEAEARAYQAAGYTGTVSPYISGWASSQTPTLTNQQAADAIIAKADALAAAKIALRNTRFSTQAALRGAQTQAELDTIMAGWDAFVASVKAGM